MVEQVELTSFDLRYEGCRMKNQAAEKALLCSILEKGIRDPLQGVDAQAGRILLNGFKRYRCAMKLQLGVVPYSSLGSDEAFGILELLRIANARSLSILEQAKLIDELKKIHAMSTADIAKLLEKSPAWVSVRIGIIAELSPAVMARMLQGQFPVYSYMYCLRPFIRLRGIKKQEVEQFVEAVSGKGLSIRDIELLANGYFKGSQEIREQILSGNIAWGLTRLKESARDSNPGLTQAQERVIRDLEILQKYMQRVSIKSLASAEKNNNAFLAQVHLLCGGIVRQADSFVKTIRQLYDTSGETKSNLSSTC
jgi:hypothetical protein